jgi:hypothetical protein
MTNDPISIFLSTPSLGITGPRRLPQRVQERHGLSTPSLGITGLN